MESKEISVSAQKKSSKKKIIGGIVAGVVIGTAVGMLLVPEKAGGIKGKLKKKGKRLMSEVKDKMESVGDADDDDDID